MNANAYTKYAILFGQKWAIFTNIRLADVWLVASARILAMAECCCGFFCFFLSFVSDKVASTTLAIAIYTNCKGETNQCMELMAHNH